MNLTRLMALGTLASHGPLHGHQIRRLAEVSDDGRWGGVSVGALYRELRLMEGEGLIRAIRTEQVGRRPARTVYSITGEGKLELALLRERAFRSQEVGPDPLGVALTFAMHGADRQQVTTWPPPGSGCCARGTSTGWPRPTCAGASWAAVPRWPGTTSSPGSFRSSPTRPGPGHPTRPARNKILLDKKFAIVLVLARTISPEGRPHADHRGPRPGPHVPQPQAHRRGSPRSGHNGLRGRDRRLPGTERGREDDHAAHADHAAAAHCRDRHGGRRRPAPRPGRGAAPDRLRSPGHRRDAGRHRPELPGRRGAHHAGRALPAAGPRRGRARPAADQPA